MKLHKLLDILDNNTIRIEKIILIGAATDGMTMTEDLRDFLEENTPEEIAQVIPGISEWLEEDDHENVNSVLEVIIESGNLGYLVQFATPQMNYTKQNPDDAFFTWGIYYREWFYANSLDKAIEKGVSWAKKMKEEDKLKSGVQKVK